MQFAFLKTRKRIVGFLLREQMSNICHFQNLGTSGNAEKYNQQPSTTCWPAEALCTVRGHPVLFGPK